MRFSETVLLSVQGDDPSWLDEARLVQEVRRELEEVDGRGREEIWVTTRREWEGEGEFPERRSFLDRHGGS